MNVAMPFVDSLRKRWTLHRRLVRIGLDSEPAKFPAHLQGHADAMKGTP